MDEKIVKDELYIPLGIKNEREYFPGFRKNEIVLISIVFAMILAGCLFYYSLSEDVFGTVIGMLILGSTAIVLIRKNENNQSVIDLAKHVFTYFRSQRKYSYVYLDEWKA
ncbi:MAG: hypothetical protein AB7V37_12090 [Eubacteriaceae bacterium]